MMITSSGNKPPAMAKKIGADLSTVIKGGDRKLTSKKEESSMIKKNVIAMIGLMLVVFATSSFADEGYIAGNWTNDAQDSLGYRINNKFYLFHGRTGETFTYFCFGRAAGEDQYLVGDWDGDGYDEIAIRRGNLFLLNYDNDGLHNEEFTFGRASGEDQYLAGDWDGDGYDEIAIRRGNLFLLNYDNDGLHDEEFTFGRASGEDQYLAGDWNGDGYDEIAIRRGTQFLLNYDNDGLHDEEFLFDSASPDDTFLVVKQETDIDRIAIVEDGELVFAPNCDSEHEDCNLDSDSGEEDPLPSYDYCLENPDTALCAWMLIVYQPR